MNRTTLALAHVLLLAAALPASAQKKVEFLTVARADPFLRTVDAGGVTTQMVQITLPSFFVAGANGLARRPATNELYALLRNDTNQRVLAVVDPMTGQATLVGLLGVNFATIAFDDEDRLWAVSGDGAEPPESLYTLDPETAAASFKTSLGAGDDGEALAFHPEDGLLYHASGLGEFAFESIDPDSLEVTPIPASGALTFEVLSMAALDEDQLVWTDLSSTLGSVTTGGSFQTIGSLDHDAKGIVAPQILELNFYCTAKINSLGCAPEIASSGVPSATAPNGFVVLCTNTYNQKLGMLLYSIDGRAATPFQGGILCLGAPVERTPASGSGGHLPQAKDCSGAYRIDMNFFARNGRRGSPLPELSQAGTLVTCQWWARDPGHAPPNSTALSNALEYEIGL
jgi:hypothetical protein